ncbi:glycosyltransferase family 4 protein [Flavobacterium collinsii]|jgi:glycosyltransferase involved in cell wall biosynthesis|uniref:glycosyltransferase family 4 protein n=1 Tax=Flavobacterium TaxID=237 RepID=UPI0022BC84B8|nr:glycosyltransferase family 4 protein [Flavobacterium collinsii]GIQ58580.1 glycosyltransferase WbuB [Flavobacterium collinsii]
MKVLFLTMVKINSFSDRGIYNDLLRKFYQEGHEIFAVCPVERRERRKTFVKKEVEGTILNVQTFNLQKTNIVEKGMGVLAIEYQFLKAIKKYFFDIKFDLIIYSTPPITFSKVINFIKQRDKAYSYLLLKDIFPQNAVDMKMLKENGVLHNIFLKKEKKLYKLSDMIGCMSEANREYILDHNPSVGFEKVEVNPNSIEPFVFFQNEADKTKIKIKYNLPIGKKIFVYGGNLGKPQGIDFLLKTIQSNTNQDAFFLIVGTGTEYNRIKDWFLRLNPDNALLLNGLPKADYDLLLNACDVGMIFLHKDFTIPNFPSRLLSYLEMKMPIISATDESTDIGTVIEKNNCGFSVISGDILAMNQAIEKMLIDEKHFNNMKENAWNLLKNEYTVDKSYHLIKQKIDV